MAIHARRIYELRQWAKTNPGLPPELREYFTALDEAFVDEDLWPTTTTSSTTTTTSSSTTTTTSSSTTTTTTE